MKRGWCWTNLNRESELVAESMEGMRNNRIGSPKLKAGGPEFAQGKIPRIVSKGRHLRMGSQLAGVLSRDLRRGNRFVREVLSGGPAQLEVWADPTVHIHIIAASTEGNVLKI